MGETIKRKKRWFFKAEILVLLFLVGVLVARTGRKGIACVGAGVLEQVVKISPDSGYANFYLGDAYLNLGEYEKAVEAYKTVIGTKPNDFQAYYNLGVAYDWLDRYEEQVFGFKEAVRIDPDDADAHRELGSAYYDKGEYDKAREEFDRAQNLGCKASGELLRGLDVKLKAEGRTAEEQKALEWQRRREILKEQEKYQLQSCDTELAHLDGYAQKEQQNIERWYAENLANLKQWEKERLEQLSAEEKIAWARYNQDVQSITSQTSASARTNTYGTASTYMVTDNWAVTDGYATTDGRYSRRTDTKVVGDPARIYESEMSRITRERNAIKTKFVELQQQRDRYLAGIKSNVESRRIAADVQKKRITRNIRVKLEGGPPPIDATCTTRESSTVVIEGQIFREGHFVNGFKIKKINDRSVEFEKDGRIWIRRMD